MVSFISHVYVRVYLYLPNRSTANLDFSFPPPPILCATPYWGRCATSVLTFCLSFETRVIVTASLALRGYLSIEDMVYTSSFRQYLLLPSQDAHDGCILLVGDARSPSCTLKQPLLIWFELSLHATRVGDGCLITGTKLVQCTRSLNGSWKRRERTPIQVDVLLFHLGDQQHL